MAKTYTLHIKAYTPETIPMARLAQYMRSFAGLIGHEHESAVHFDRLAEGSTQLVSRVDHEEVPKVRASLDALARGEASVERIKAQEDLDALLAADNATGFVYEDEDPGAKIIDFPGVTRPRPFEYGPVRQEGTLDGVLVSIGGADKTIHIRLQNGDLKYTGLETDRDTARHLAKHLFEPVRVFGTGNWLRGADGTWTLKRFKIQGFDVLRQDDLRDVVDDLRAVEGSEWSTLDDPLATLRALRG